MCALVTGVQTCALPIYRHADVFIARPDSEGPWPVILFYMDAPGIRPELHAMARRQASRGYLVVLPNLFYRQGLNPRLGPVAKISGSEEKDRMIRLMHSLSVEAVMDDSAALTQWRSGVATVELDR